MSRSTRLLMGSALLISSLACSIPVLAEPATDHARFYPDGTQFFADINAPNDYSHRTLEWAAKQIDMMAPSTGEDEPSSPKTKWVKKKIKGRWVNVAVKVPQPKTVAKKPTKSATEVLTELEKLVEPVMSVGLWDLKGEGNKKLSASFAITINTKPALTADYIQSKSENKTKAPVVVENVGTMFESVSKNSPTILLTNDNHMILTDKVADMQQIIDVMKSSQPALQQSKLYKDSLALLDADGQTKPDGTFFWNVRDFSLEKMGFTPTALGLIPPPKSHGDDRSSDGETTSEKPEPSKKELMAQAVFEQYTQNYEQLLKAFPYGTASLRFAPTPDLQDQIVLDLLCPYAASNVSNTRLKTALDNYMTHQGPTKLGQWLPENTMFAMEAKNAADYVWLLTEMISTPEMRTEWKDAMPPILKASKFSVKKHMLGFIDGEFGIALTPKSVIPGVVTLFNLNKDTKEFLDWGVELATHGEKGVMITEGTPMSSQDWMKIVTAPKVPFELAYGSLNQNTLVSGIKPAVDDMRQLIDTQAGNGTPAISSSDMASTPLAPLNQSPIFKTLTQSMPEKTQFWSYINLNAFAQWTDTNFGNIINTKVKPTALKKAQTTKVAGKKIPTKALESKEPFSVVKFLQPVQGVASWSTMATPSLYKSRVVFLMAPGLLTRKTDSPL